eukprot:3077296-Lingulodinium_polyedra.AAC.1
MHSAVAVRLLRALSLQKRSFPCKTAGQSAPVQVVWPSGRLATRPCRRSNGQSRRRGAAGAASRRP